jgi:hypothetical protein
MKASTETILSIFGKLIQFGEKLYVIFNWILGTLENGSCF